MKNNKIIAIPIAGLVIASVALIFIMKLSIQPVYPDFIVGYLAWNGSSKMQDLIVGPIFIGVLMAAIFCINYIYKKYGSLNEKTLNSLSNQIIFWSIPWLIDIAGLINGHRFEKNLVFISALGILFVVIGSYISLNRRLLIKPRDISLGFFGILLISLIPFELSLILNKYQFLNNSELTESIRIKLSQLIFLFGILLLYFKLFKDSNRWNYLCSYIICFGQIGLLIIYLTIYPSVLLSPEGKFFEYKSTFILIILISLILLIGLINIYTNFIKFLKTGNLIETLSPVAIFSILIVLKFGGTVAPHISPDDYHFGELLVGFWSYLQGSIPYVDYMPPHGLIDDDLAMFFNHYFFDGTAGAMPEASRICFILLSLVAFLSLFNFTKSIPISFYGILFIGGRYAWIFLIPFLCLWLNSSLQKSPKKWLLVWFITFPLLIIGVPAQGLMIFVASLPMAIAYCFYTFRNASFKILKMELFVFLFFLIFYVFLFRNIFIGAINYVFQNGVINIVSYGVPWELNWGYGINKGFLFELIRMSWLFIPFIALSILISNFSKLIIKKHLYFSALLSCIFCFLMISYSMGRIDPGGISRPGVVALFGWVILLPLMSIKILNANRKIILLMIVAVMGGALSSNAILANGFASSFAANRPTQPLKSGADVGLQNIGISYVDDIQWQRLVNLKYVLSSKLLEGETYLDLTSRNAQYFYLGYKPPVAVTAPYNMVSIAQQKKAVEGLKKAPPPIILLEGANIIHDGGGLALRNPYLFRYILANYVPSYENGFIIGKFAKDGEASQVSTLRRVPVKSFTDVNWLNGFNRSEPAVIIDDPVMIQFLSIGDTMITSNGVVRRVSRISVEGSSIWLEGGQFYAKDFDKGNFLTWRSSAQNSKNYEIALFHKAIAQADLMGIPAAWGKSEKSLDAKMKFISALEEDGKKKNPTETKAFQQNPTTPRVYSVFKPQVSELSGRDAGLIKFNFSCVGQKRAPRMQVFWWDSEAENSLASRSLKFSPGEGANIVPLDAFPSWIKMDQINGLRIELINPSDCSEIQVRDIGLYQRSFD